MKKRRLTVTLAVMAAMLFLGNLFIGSVSIPFMETVDILTGGGSRDVWKYIVLDSRLPQALTAAMAGAALAVSGLLLQTIFSNPLAGPSILGINNGASLGVAVVMLASGGSIGSAIEDSTGFAGVIAGAFIGASAVLALIIFFSTVVRSNVMLLIIGIMVGYLTSSLISILNFFASADGVFAYTVWGMGDFSSVNMEGMKTFVPVILAGLMFSILLVKPMNALLLGERYASNVGINIRRTRLAMLAATGLLTGTVTAFCGPVSFIGLSVPHIARLFSGSSDHRILVPDTILAGSCVALLCNMLCSMPGAQGILPLNAVTPVIGAPVILYVIMNQKKIQYFN